MESRIVVLHVAPHPDDEAIAAPATLLALRDAGHRVINLLASLGRPTDSVRRRAEAEEAARRMGLELVVHDPPLAISGTDNLDHAQQHLAMTLHRVLKRECVSLVVGPSPHDSHHGHEAVGRALRDAVAMVDAGTAPRWWMWGLWGELAFPTLYVPFDTKRLEEILHGLGAYAGELARNDYRALVHGRAEASRVLGSERVFGFGASACGDLPYAELLTEVVKQGECWRAAEARVLDPLEPLAWIDFQADLSWWIEGASFADRVRAHRCIG